MIAEWVKEEDFDEGEEGVDVNKEVNKDEEEDVDDNKAEDVQTQKKKSTQKRKALKNKGKNLTWKIEKSIWKGKKYEAVEQVHNSILQNDWKLTMTTG